MANLPEPLTRIGAETAETAETTMEVENDNI